MRNRGLPILLLGIALGLAGSLLLRGGSAPMVSSVPTWTPQPITFEATCTRVIDGDTIELEGGERVRYIGMDTPEMRPVQAWAKAATEANRDLVEGRTVRLELDVQQRDRYGRLLAYVYVGDLFVNEELVRLGYARVSTYPPDVRYEQRFLAAERAAREANRGLWSPDAPR